jgi:hypothetical protein
MTSFINLLASDIWSEADIVNRTEAMIASEFSAHAVAILNRKVTAATIGAYTLTADEQAEVARYAQVCTAAATEGNAARADMALLQSALDCEADPALIALAAPEVLELMALRSPAAVEEEGAP